MRTGGYTVNQTLTTEAATIVKQAVSLARRRGHAQVTPLHVATSMLASSTGLLRAACLQSHSHPLQCKALELCFNVALNRLPTTASTPILAHHHHHHHHPPSLSNALVAAFKRAQAHQRRGSVENQQQPILALKVELEQLVISILDDPSVSRVMREAGFSSTQVKTNVEKAVSLEIFSHQTPPPVSTKTMFRVTTLNSNNNAPNCAEKARSEDVMSVLDSLMSKKRRNNSVVVGECLASAEGVVRGVIDKFDRGDVPSDMRHVQFISLPLSTLRKCSPREAEQRVGELRSLVKSCVGRGVVLYLGDLKWVSEFWSNYGGQSRNYYCPVEVMIMELGRILSGIEEVSGKLWLMGIATFQTYLRCKRGQPSLETLWRLHPLTIPVGSLGLSLTLESDLRGQSQSKLSAGDESSWSQIKIGLEKNLTCCADCLTIFNREAQSIASTTTCYQESTTISTSSSLPSWLQQCKEENQRKTINDQEFNKLRDLCKKWNSICSSVHKQPHFLEKPLNFSSISSPSSSTSISSYDHQQHSPKLHQTLLNWPVIFEPKRSPIEHQFLIHENEPKPDLLSNPNSSPNSASCSEADEEDVEFLDRFKDLNSENFKVLCNALERKVPWQKDIIPDIATTVLECRSGIIRRKDKSSKHKEETWLFFLGVDLEGKEKIAKELAKLVFGSQSNFVAIGLSNFPSTRADSSEEVVSNKRARDESGSTYFERFAEAVGDNPSRVFFLEDVEQVDYFSQKGIKKAIESGRVTLSNGDSIHLKDSIVIFSCESFSSMSRACSPPTRSTTKSKDDQNDSLDLNIATDHQDDDSEEDGRSVADIGILDSVDRQIVFKIQVL